MKSVKIILGGSWGHSPPEAKSYSFFDSAPNYLRVIPVFRLCQYVLQFTADNIEYF